MIRAVVLALLLSACGPRPAVVPLPPALAGNYDPSNVFARIVRGESPTAKVYEDRDVLAFMDTSPLTPGHVLVISKSSRTRNLLDIAPRDLAKVMAVARRIADAQLIALAPDGIDGVRIMQNNGSAQSVFHFHVHVLPHRRGVWASTGTRTPVADLQPMAARIAAALR